MIPLLFRFSQTHGALHKSELVGAAPAGHIVDHFTNEMMHHERQFICHFSELPQNSTHNSQNVPF